MEQSTIGAYTMTFFGYRIEKISDAEAKGLERAKEVLERHGFRAVRVTTDKTNKSKSAKEATKIRADRAKKKVLNAMAELENVGQKVNIANVAKLADVSRITAKKYMGEVHINYTIDTEHDEDL